MYVMDIMHELRIGTSNGLKELFPPSIMQLRFVEELHFSNNPLGQSIHLDVQKWAELNRLDEPDNDEKKSKGVFIRRLLLSYA